MKNLIIVAVSAFLSTTAFSQTIDAKPKTNVEVQKNRAEMEDGKKMAEELAIQLGLSDAQKQKLEAAFKVRQEKMKALKDAQMADKEANKMKRREIQDEFLKATQATLTPEQQQKWKEIKKEKSAEMRAKRAKGKVQKAEEKTTTE